MASESDCEEFFDAQDSSINVSKSKTPHLRIETTKETLNESNPWEEIKSPCPTLEEIKESERKARDNERRRKKVEELRRKMLTDEDDESEMLSQNSSKASSVDGVYTGILDSKLPFSRKEFVDESKSEVNSVISLGKIGNLLGDVNVDTLSIDSRDSMTSTGDSGNKFPLAEPDLVASTKGDRNISNDGPQPPVAPPRRRRKAATKQHSLENTKPFPDTSRVPCLPSPTSAVASIAHELEYSLDLKSAIRGQYVVKPQDHERDRAPTVTKETTLNHDTTDNKSESRLTTPKGSLGTNSSKSNSRRNSGGPGDDNLAQANIMMRTRSDSGRPLTDLEILEQVMVLNLDTGEAIPLSLAEDRLPRGINPLSLHIMRLTSEYVSNSSLEKEKESDEESVAESHKTSVSDSVSVLKKTAKLKKMIGRTVEKTVNKIKNVADEVYHSKHNEEIEDSEEDNPAEARPSFKFKAAHGHKGPHEFDNVKEVQDLTGEHTGAIWTMKFSYCGRLLATAGQDHILRIWVLRDSYNYFNEMRLRYNAEIKVSPTPSQESLVSQHSAEDPNKLLHPDAENSEDSKGPFMSKPFCTYHGHTADLLDVSWSKNYFILSSSMDKTVRLWHISRKECLCCFQHIDFVTAIAFHPRDDRYFLSGSLDGKLRLWNIPDKKVALWNELDGQTKLITSASFCQNGKFAVIGSYDGRCIFYHTEQLKYYTQIHVRSSRGKNKQGRKISGIEPMPGEDKILVTSNDSRIRMYDLRDLSLSCKYKGYVNLSSQIKSNFSHDGKYIISGSENQFIYVWKTNYDYSKFSSARRDRNYYWEGIKAHNAVVTAAVFAPNPSLILSQLDQQDPTLSVLNQPPHSETNNSGYVFVSADFSGVIKVFVKKNKGKAATLPAGLP